jgi:hypothetical protein
MMSSMIQAARGDQDAKTRGDQDAKTSGIRGRIAANTHQIAILTVTHLSLPVAA